MSRYFNADNDRANAGVTAIPTTGSMFFWYYPTFTIADSAIHAGFRVRNQSAVDDSLRIFDLMVKSSDNNVYAGWLNGTGAGDDERISSTAATFLTINTWHSCILTWTDGGLSSFWINGNLVGSNGTTTTWNSTGHDRMIGNDEFALTTEANARIEHVAIWDRVLDAGERAALEAGCRPDRFGPTDYWPLLGLDSPEPNMVSGGTSATLTGTTQANGAPVQTYSQRWWNWLLSAEEAVGQAYCHPFLPHHA